MLNLKYMLTFLLVSTLATAASKNEVDLRIIPKTTANRPTGVEGQLFTNSTTHTLQYKDNSTWFSTVGDTTTQTLTNKTIAVGSNTISGTVSRVPQFSGAGALEASAVTNTELGYLGGVTSAIQTQMDLKAPLASPTFTGTITTPLTLSRAVVTNGSSALAASATTATEIGYVSGVTSAIQTQLGTLTTNVALKAPLASPTFTGTITTPLTISRAVVTDGSSALAASAATATEVGYLSGVTSAIQTQINTISATAAVGSAFQQSNIGIKSSISANTLVIELKQADAATDCTAGSPCSVGFRNATAATGGYTTVSFTAATSLTLSATDSIGKTSSQELYVYLVADTPNEVCASSTLFDEGTVKSASALTGAADTVAATLWCTTAHTSRAIRLVGKVAASWGNPNWSAITKTSPTLNYPSGIPSPSVTVQTSGSGTYIPPSGARYLRVRMVGGGGGGAGSATQAANNGGAGGIGVDTTFGAATASGGGAGPAGAGGSAAGGAAAGGTINIPGGRGGGAGATTSSTVENGGSGGSSAFGGAGASGGNAVGQAASANSGSGGSGGASVGTASFIYGGGGGSGGYVEWMITSPAASYAYAVGTGGAAGTAGTSGLAGGAGAAGIIIVEEFY